VIAAGGERRLPGGQGARQAAQALDRDLVDAEKKAQNHGARTRRKDMARARQDRKVSSISRVCESTVGSRAAGRLFLFHVEAAEQRYRCEDSTL
jgi:hypothetical protein